MLITCEMQGETAASTRKVLGYGSCLCGGAGLKISFGRPGEWELQDTYRECPSVMNSQAKQHQLLAVSVTLPGPQASDSVGVSRSVWVTMEAYLEVPCWSLSCPGTEAWPG